MTPAARVQSAIDLLDEIIVAARDGGAAADAVATAFFKARRYAGSKDRRAVRDLAWAAIRRFGKRPASGRAALVGLARKDATLAALFTGGPHAPAPIAGDEPGASGGMLPAWIEPLLAAPLKGEGEWAALLARAPLDLRVNRLKSDVAAVRAALPDAEPVDGLPNALRLPTDHSVAQADAYLDGLVEVQDAGSQWIVAACRAASGQTILDVCAGAGGKTVALAADAGTEATIIAADTNRQRLSVLMPRAVRAGADDIETRLLDPGKEAAALSDLTGACDLVLVDAPCSGSGTWRRNPETRWRLTPQRLDRLVEEQARLLDIAAPLARPGGALVYAVCSLLDREGAEQVAAFLARTPRWTAVPVPGGREHAAGAGQGRLLTPAHDGTDGFFYARLERLC